MPSLGEHIALIERYIFPGLGQSLRQGQVDELSWQRAGPDVLLVGIRTAAQQPVTTLEGTLIGATVHLQFCGHSRLHFWGGVDPAGLQIHKLSDTTFSAYNHDNSRGITFDYGHVEDGGWIAHYEGAEKKTKKRLFTYRTLYNACANELQSQGLHLKCAAAAGTHGGLEYVLWRAISDDHRLEGANPVELLGLAELIHRRGGGLEGPYWWNREDDEDLAWNAVEEHISKHLFMSIDDLRDD